MAFARDLAAREDRSIASALRRLLLEGVRAYTQKEAA
jgi:hypothetical protein